MTETTEQILREARDKLVDREQRLAAFIDEHKRTVKAREGVEKTLRSLGASVPNDRVAQQRDKREQAPPTGELADAIVEACRTSIDPLSPAELALKIGREPGGYIAMCATKLVNAGTLIKIDGKYGLAQQGTQETGTDA